MYCKGSSATCADSGFFDPPSVTGAGRATALFVVTSLPSRNAFKFSITSLSVTSLKLWIALMSATSKWSFLFGAHFIRPSASANWSISSSSRSVSINSACAASDSCESRSTSSLSASGFTLNTSRSRKYEIRSAISRIMSLPASHCSCSNCTASAVAERKILSVKFATVWWLVNPKTFNTSASLIGSPQNATSWSSIDSASRSPPSAPRAIACAAAGSRENFSLPAMN